MSWNTASATEGRPGEAEIRDKHDEAQRQLREHPGFIEHFRINAFAITLLEVYCPNWSALMSTLGYAAEDPIASLQMSMLIQNHVVGQEDLVAQIARGLHNYVASAATLVDHGRLLMDGRTGAVSEEFETRKTVMLAEPEISFVQGLRNFSLHRSLPVLGHTLKIAGNEVASSEVELSCANLLVWSNWPARAKRFIEESGQSITLRPALHRHFELVYGLNSWLLTALGKENEAAVVEANELVVAANAVLMNVDHETARRRMDADGS